jgi:hypothetical protein
VKELTIIAGRGAGKDSIASALATHAAISFDPKGRLRPGEKAHVIAIACDRDQARIVFDFIKGYFEEVPALKEMVVDINAESIELTNRVVIEVHSNSYRSVRGRSILCAILDEVALFRSDDSANPDSEVHAAIVPGLRRVQNSMMIMISSAYRRTGLLYERFADYYGKNDDDRLVIKATTLQLNPTADAKEIAKDILTDPARFNAEYNSEWRDDLSTFISRELLDACTDFGVHVRPPQREIIYSAFADPSGGRNDSFTCAIGHSENDIAILDCVIEIKAPFNPEDAVKHISDVLRSYEISKVTGDHYAEEWVVSAFARHGIVYEKSERDRSKIYIDTLPLFTAGRCRLIEQQRMYAQFVGLERRAMPSGNDKVNHAKNAHDDVCNSVAGVLVLIAEPTGAEQWSRFNANAGALGVGVGNALPTSAVAFAAEYNRRWGNVF